jgi:hypothetical protein
VRAHSKNGNSFADKPAMERRKQPRIDLKQEVTVSILGDLGQLPFHAVILDMSGSGMRILSPHPVAYQATVKVEAGDLLLLGEVIRVEVSSLGSVLAVKILHSLDCLSDLRRLSHAVRLEGQEESCLRDAVCDTMRFKTPL